MSVNRGAVERAASDVVMVGRRSVGELEEARVNFSVTPLGRENFLADSTNGANLKGR